MKVILKTHFRFLAKGTVLRKDVSGNYFVSISDEDHLESPIQTQKITVNGHYVEANPEIFEVIDKVPGRSALLHEAVRLLNTVEDDNSIVQDAIAHINLALRSDVD